MPWGFAVAAVGALGGAYMSSEGAKDAAKIQKEGAGDATAVQKDIFSTTNQQQQPYIGAGYGALSTLTRAMGTPQPIYGDPAAPPITGEQPMPGADAPMPIEGGGELMPRGPGGGNYSIPGNPKDGRADYIPGRPVKSHAALAQKAGRAGDNYLVHVNAEELGEMQGMWGEPSVNPNTGLREYGFWSKVKKAFDPKRALSSESIAGMVINPVGHTVKEATGKDIGPSTMLIEKAFGKDDPAAPVAAPESAANGYGLRIPTGFTPDKTGLEDGYLTQRFGPEQFAANVDPGYRWRMQQGTQAVMNSAAPSVGALSGPALKALMSYGQGEASQEYGSAFDRFQTQQGNIFQRLSSLVNLGQNAAAGVGQQGVAVGGNIGSNIVGGANAGAAGVVGGANAWSGALSDLGSLGYMYSQRP